MSVADIPLAVSQLSAGDTQSTVLAADDVQALCRGSLRDWHAF
jgi:hypothetical protein